MPTVQMRTLMPRGAKARAQADADNKQWCQDWRSHLEPSLTARCTQNRPHVLLVASHTLEILLPFLHNDRAVIVLMAHCIVLATDASFYV